MSATEANSAGSPRRDLTHQRATPYLHALTDYAAAEPHRLNVPGHHGPSGADPVLLRTLGPAVFELDVPPLMSGIDAGLSPNPLERAQALAAEAWGARRTWFLTNGASQGNVIACLVGAMRGGAIVAQRNMHSSLLAGVVLAGLSPSFVFPEIDQRLGVAHVVGRDAVREAIERTPEARLVFIVSPTYFGATADVEGIARICHEAGVPLAVDEAWGGHFGQHPELPRSALSCGADIVVSSTHKLVGSLTQSAMLHVGEGPHAAELEGQIDRAFPLVESTSSSSILKASLDGARRRLAVHGRELLTGALAVAERIRQGVSELDCYSIADKDFALLPDVVANDPLRIVIDVSRSGRSGLELGVLLRTRYQLDLEVFTHAAIVAIVGPAEESSTAGERLIRALDELSVADPQAPLRPGASVLYGGSARLTPREALCAPSELVPARSAHGRVSSDTLAAYPPGIPNVLAGEELTGEVVDFLAGVVAEGGYVRGAADPSVEHLRVVGR